MAVAIRTQPGDTLTLPQIAVHYRVPLNHVRAAVVNRRVPIKDGRVSAVDQSNVYFGALAENRVRMYRPVAANGDALNIGDDVIVEGGDEGVIIDVDDDDGRVYVAVADGNEVEKLPASQRYMDGPAVCDEIERKQTIGS
jgi:preprotein translocase subunit YajC